MRDGCRLPSSAFRQEGVGERSSGRSSLRRKTEGGRRQPIQVEISGSVRGWVPSGAALAAWASAALGRKAPGREISVRLVGPGESRALNARYRGRDKSTNVLSFPAGAAAGGFMGDLVICPAVLRREALQQRKSVRAHWAHLVVHGTLHLAGYDHERAADARRMERREIAVLRRLGFSNPYRRSL